MLHLDYYLDIAVLTYFKFDYNTSRLFFHSFACSYIKGNASPKWIIDPQASSDKCVYIRRRIYSWLLFICYNLPAIYLTCTILSANDMVLNVFFFTLRSASITFRFSSRISHALTFSGKFIAVIINICNI